MKLAISSNDGKWNTPFSARFARCDAFIFINTETQRWETTPNPAAAARGGAGAQVVQFLANSGVEATITGRYGPTAFSALEAAGIQAFTASGGTPAELLEQFLAGELEQVKASNGQKRHL